MNDKDYSWRGSWNAGKVLSIVALLLGLAIVLVGFTG